MDNMVMQIKRFNKQESFMNNKSQNLIDSNTNHDINNNNENLNGLEN